MDPAGPILCLGEVIADLICNQPADTGEAPDRLVPYPGGALANVAVGIARTGVPAAISGGVGTDIWGDWLVRGLDQEGVSTDWLVRLEHVDTPIGMVYLDHTGEPVFQIYGEHIGPAMAAAGELLAEAIPACSALVIGSNTMVGAVEREVTRRAVELSASRGLPILYDPNFRPNRWRDPGSGRSYLTELARMATVIKCNRQEAELMTGEADPLAAARALADQGVPLTVVTDGADPVITAGATEAVSHPEPVEVVSPLGAGDAFMGTLAADLFRLDWEITRAGEILDRANRAATLACSRLGAQN